MFRVFFACVSGVWLTVWRYVWQSPTNVWCKVTIITLWQASHPPVSSHAFLPMTVVINEITRILWLKTGNTNHTAWMSAVTDTKTKRNCKQPCFYPNPRRHFKVLSPVNTILVSCISDFIYTYVVSYDFLFHLLLDNNYQHFKHSSSNETYILMHKFIKINM